MAVQIDFDGPMDLLLKLVEKNEISIYDVKIAEITDEFIYHMYKTPIENNEIASFILTASTLIEIKSNALLPKSLKVEDDPHETLIAQVEDYKKTKILQGLLEDEYRKESLRHSKIKNEYIPIVTNINLDESVSSLLEVYEKLIGQYNLYRNENDLGKSIINKEEFSVSDYILKIKNLLSVRKSMNIVDLISSHTSKNEVIVIFLAILELIKTQELHANQNGQDILIKEK